MLLKRIKFLALSLIVLGSFTGCGTIMREMSKVKLDRPLQEQPTISKELKKKLAAIDLKDMIYYVRGTQYFDSSVVAKMREVATENRTIRFTKEYPLVKDPPPAMKELGEFLKLLLANELRARGLQVSEKSCGGCIDVDIDYAYRIDPTFVGAEEVLNLRPNMSYDGVLFAQGRDDGKLPRNLGVGGEKNRWALKPPKEKGPLLAPALKPLADEMLYVLGKVLGKDTTKK